MTSTGSEVSDSTRLIKEPVISTRSTGASATCVAWARAPAEKAKAAAPAAATASALSAGIGFDMFPPIFVNRTHTGLQSLPAHRKVGDRSFILLTPDRLDPTRVNLCRGFLT